MSILHVGTHSPLLTIIAYWHKGKFLEATARATKTSSGKLYMYIYYSLRVMLPMVTYSIFNTLAFRGRVVYSNQQTLQQENAHIRKVLLACNFSPQALKALQNLTTDTTSTV